MIKIGDKVRFLNSIGGGVVRRFISKDMVSVEEDDGFEMPILIKECVLIADAGEVTADNSKNLSDKVNKSLERPVAVRETKTGERLNFHLAFIAGNDRALSTSDFDAYFVNDSNYWLFFTYMSRVGANWETRFAGMVEPNMKMHLERFGKDVLNDMDRVCIQGVAFKRDKDFQLKQPVNVEIKIDTVKFYKLHSFKTNDFFDENALIYSVIKEDEPQRPVDVSPNELEKALKEKRAIDNKSVAPKNAKIRNGIVEVDLHIDELLDTTAGMNSADMLAHQIDEFNKVINTYKHLKGQKIVFIHGKGDGVLRKAILDELKKRYPRYTSQDASFREYGYGATMITIK